MTLRYFISHSARPHAVLFTGQTLEDAAASLRAQPDTAGLVVYASEAGFSRDLSRDEEAQLVGLLGPAGDEIGGAASGRRSPS